jgi:F-type H+-transporting ATPase subunit 8
MPQLIPYFFLHEILISFIIFGVIIYINSIYFLPLITLKQLIRFYIIKLNKK